jgi:hypothetical protein
VAWPRPLPKKAVPAVVRSAPSTPLEPPDTARPADDAPTPGEAIAASEQATVAATDYVLAPGAHASVIDMMTRLARVVRRARDAMEAHRAAAGQYDPEDVEALHRAAEALDHFRASKGD